MERSAGEEETDQAGNRSRDGFVNFPVDKNTNLLYHPLPDLDRKRLIGSDQFLFRKCALWLGILSSLITFIPYARLRVPLLFIEIYCVCYYFSAQAKIAFDDIAVDRERQRGLSAANGNVPEAAEWLNQVLRKLWSMLDPEIFEPAKDLLEDIVCHHSMYRLDCS